MDIATLSGFLISNIFLQIWYNVGYIIKIQYSRV